MLASIDVLPSALSNAMCALHRLCIPTVRAVALAVGEGGEACLLRLSRSLLRFGTLELCNQPASNGKAGPSVGDYALLRCLAKHVMSCFYPAVLEIGPDEGDEHGGYNTVRVYASAVLK